MKSTVAVALAGALLGGVVVFGVLYKKPGSRLIEKVGRVVDNALGGAKDAAEAAADWTPAAGLKLEAHKSGFDYPVRLVFHPTPPEQPGAPLYYVAELDGRIKVVTKDGTVHTFAERLLNFERTPLEELGLLGMCYDEWENQMFVTLAYWDAGGGVYRNRVERLGCSDDGLSMTDRTVVLDMKSEATVASYQIQFCALGPDGLLYVGVGSGGKKSDAQRLDKFAGKILCMEKDGTSVATNPFYDPEHPDAPRSYVYAYGLRNPFDIAWDPRSFIAVVSDVGPGIDRIVRLEPGVNYCFEMDENQMRANALYTWGPVVEKNDAWAPTGVAFLQPEALDFDRAYRLCVGLFGRVHVPGPNKGKRVVEFELSLKGWLDSWPSTLMTYTGKRFCSITDVESGPDGLYFLDLYGETPQPHRDGGVVYRIVKDPDYVAPVDASASLTGVARGKYLYTHLKCFSCHVMDGYGGSEGPPLVNLGERLDKRLNSAEYEATLKQFADDPGEYFQSNRETYGTLLSLSGEQRVRAWLHAHIADPRFDNPKAKMPSHELPEEDLAALTQFLLTK